MATDIVSNDISAINPQQTRQGITKSRLIGLNPEMGTRAKRRLPMSKLTASYIAGFVDGEGYIGLMKNSGRYNHRRQDYYIAVLKVGNTNKEIIYWLKDSFGGTIWERKGTSKRKIAYLWTLNNKNLIPFLDKIYPYLRIKRKQAEIIKKFKTTFGRESYTFPERQALNGGKFISKTLDEKVIRYREELYSEIRELNKRGNLLYAERLNNETPL